MTLALTKDGKLTTAKAHKYGAKPKTVDGIRFASTAEADAYAKLLMLERAGEVTRLIVQPRFPLHAGIIYVADFDVTFADGSRIIYDVKGWETPVFKLKEKLFRADYPELKLELWR